MATSAKRLQLMNYLAETTEKKVNALYILLEEEIKENAFTLTKEHLTILESRDADYSNGKSKITAWEKAHRRIQNRNKPV